MVDTIQWTFTCSRSELAPIGYYYEPGHHSMERMSRHSLPQRWDYINGHESSMHSARDMWSDRDSTVLLAVLRR